ncbi:hypothetical protein [Streptomyces sp. B3I7]|uniref:hypothetical protein n=1 Tax=Streptomyces sp. B3I7 TaxID=3042269 RepID=UPI0027D8838C|nr:hypothetical protein [Streptomyces sp. B3I7]
MAPPPFGRAGWPDDLTRALAGYDTTLRPFVDEIQAVVKPRLLRLGMPESRPAIGAFHSVTAPACFLHVPGLVARSEGGPGRGVAAPGESGRGGGMTPAGPTPCRRPRGITRGRRRGSRGAARGECR